MEHLGAAPGSHCRGRTLAMPIASSRPDDVIAPTGGVVRAPRRPADWVVPGPRPRLAHARPGDEVPLELWPLPDEDLGWLAGDFRILQRRDGHRWSLDDLLTAWLAARVAREPRRVCDLGCGIGTVLLFLSWRFPGATLLGIEAQAQSAAMARRSLRWNDVTDRVEVRDGDLRELVDDRGFDLVSGTPPYFPIGTGVESARPQCSPCRFEHRGGVEAYIDAMARVLAPHGRGVLCQGAGQAFRVAPSVTAAGLFVETQLDVVPREGKSVLISLFVLSRDPAAAHQRETLVVRSRDARWTDDYRAVRRDLGMPPGRDD